MKNFLVLFIFCCATAFGQNIAVVTVNSKGTKSSAFLNKQCYCSMHHYDLYYKKKEKSKIPSILQALQKNYDWVLWLNEDALFMNLDIALEELTDDEYDLILTQDKNGISADVFLIKKGGSGSLMALQSGEPVNFKIIPQRMLNAYPEEVDADLKSAYQLGDFILNMRGYPGLDEYTACVVSDRNLVTLDHYLGYYGFKLTPAHNPPHNEGYMSDAQKVQFTNRLKQFPHIKRIAEIGLNGGHSAENFFKCCSLEKFLSFDLNIHPYTSVAVEYFTRKYQNQFEFIAGDSQVSIPQYMNLYPNETFDLIYIDGSHTYDNCLNDIKNCGGLAHDKTILWIDDFHDGNDVQRAVLDCHNEGVVSIINIYQSTDHTGLRSWVEALYLK